VQVGSEGDLDLRSRGLAQRLTNPSNTASLLVADFVSYSRLIEADEAGTWTMMTRSVFMTCCYGPKAQITHY
jgi:class 3 adenylate cyclase